MLHSSDAIISFNLARPQPRTGRTNTGVVCERECVASDNVQVQISIDAEKAFADADWALLIGAKPRGPGMERRDLLDLNGEPTVLSGRYARHSASRSAMCVTGGAVVQSHGADTDK